MLKALSLSGASRGMGLRISQCLEALRCLGGLFRGESLVCGPTDIMRDPRYGRNAPYTACPWPSACAELSRGARPFADGGVLGTLFGDHRIRACLMSGGGQAVSVAAHARLPSTTPDSYGQRRERSSNVVGVAVALRQRSGGSRRSWTMPQSQSFSWIRTRNCLYMNAAAKGSPAISLHKHRQAAP